MKPQHLALAVLVLILALLLSAAAAAQGPTQPVAMSRAGSLAMHAPPYAADADGESAADPEATLGPRRPAPASAQATDAPAVNLGQPGLSFRYVRTFGETERPYIEDTNHFYNVAGIGVDGANVWIADSWGDRALKFDGNGAFLQQIGKAGVSDATGVSLDFVSDVAVDQSGNTWVVDAGAQHIAKYDATGKHVSELGKAWDGGSGNDQFNDPLSIAFDSAGNIYVSDAGVWGDYGNQRVQVFDGAGAYRATIGVTGVAGSDNSHFRSLRRIALYADRLYIADAGNHRVQVFNVSNPSAPAYVVTLGVSGVSGSDNSHFDYPEGVGVDANFIYVADSNNNRVQIFDRNTRAYVATLGAGAWGTDNNHFDHPSDVAVDSAGRIYVADNYNKRVQQFDSGRAYRRTYGTTGVPYVTDGYHYYNPTGVAVAADGSIYIVEERGHRLVKLNAAGDPLWTVGQPGQNGNDNAHFFGPNGVAVDSAGRAYVAESWSNHRVQIFSPDGTYYATLGTGWGTGDYEFNGPQGVAVSSRDGTIFVADTGNHRVQVFNSNRQYLSTIGVTSEIGSDSAHFYSPRDVAVDDGGNAYVADLANHRVQKCSRAGAAWTCTTIAGETGVSGDDFGHLSNPTAVTVDAQRRLYVADQWGGRVQVFDATGAYLTTVGGSWGNRPGQMRNAEGLAVDTAGNLYVAEKSNNQRIQKFAPGVPGWRQVNINGFGDRRNSMVGSLDVLNGQMFAGTWSGAEGYGAQVWRTVDGHGWSPMTPSWSVSNTSVFDAEPFTTQLYVGTGNSSGGEIWRTDGVSWEQVMSGGFGDPNNYAINALAVFSETIYGATSNTTSGTQIWRNPTGASGGWTRVDITGFSGPRMSADSVMDVYRDHLYIGFSRNATGQNALAELWRTGDGLTWTPVFTDGLAAKNTNVSGMAEFRGDLYLGLRNTTSGGQVWRSSDGLSWHAVFTGGLGDLYNGRPYGLIVFNDSLYVVFSNLNTGAEVWRTTDGSVWQPVVKEGWGDSNNGYADYVDKGAATFNNRLYIGTFNSANGGEIWMKTLTADFTATPTRGAPPLTVAFANISAGDFTASQWDFGDGGTSTAISPTHTFTMAGTYTVTLTVGDGTDSSSHSDRIYVLRQVYLPLVMRYDPLLYDDFNDPAFNGTYNPALWQASDTTGYEIRQSNGALVFSNPAPAWRTVNMTLKRPEVRSLQELSLLQARFKLGGDCTAETAEIRLQYSAQNVAEYDEWVAECRLCRGCYYQQTNSAVCSITLWKNRGSRYEYFTPGKPIDADTWHLLRIETDSHTADVRFYLDDSLIGSHTPQDAHTLLDVTTFQSKIVALNSGDGVKCTRYVDDVRITPAR